VVSGEVPHECVCVGPSGHQREGSHHPRRPLTSQTPLGASARTLVYWLVSKAEQSAFTRLKWVENRALIGQDRVPIFNQHFHSIAQDTASRVPTHVCTRSNSGLQISVLQTSSRLLFCPINELTTAPATSPAGFQNPEPTAPTCGVIVTCAAHHDSKNYCRQAWIGRSPSSCGS
jgi:hypothetical protein